MSAPLCIACVHCYRRVSILSGPFAPARVVTGPAQCALTDRVHGDGRDGIPCTAERTTLGLCGPDGLRFQPRPIPASAPPKPRRWWQWWRA
jgi:hypothetical protein